MITAGRGLGKTWLSLSIALGIVTKSSVGKWKAENSADVLYIDGEMAADELQARLKKLCVGKAPLLARLDFLTSELMHQAGYPTPNLSDKAWRDAIYNKLQQSGIYKVIILDNLASLTPGIDENDKKEWDPVNQWLLDIRRLGVAVIMIHHTGKNTHIMRGSSAKEDNLDVSIYLLPPSKRRPDDGAKFKVTFAKARSIHGGSAVPFELELIEHEERLVWLVGEIKAENKHKVIKALGEGKLQKDIAKEVGLNPSRISQIKKEAIKEGWLNKNGSFTEAGRRAFGDPDVDD